MGTVTLGGRELDVRPDTLGFAKHKLLPWTEKDVGAGPGRIDWLVEGILLYVGHNEGVDAGFVEANVRESEIADLFKALRAAAGRKEEPQGEAARP